MLHFCFTHNVFHSYHSSLIPKSNPLYSIPIQSNSIQFTPFRIQSKSPDLIRGTFNEHHFQGSSLNTYVGTIQTNTIDDSWGLLNPDWASSDSWSIRFNGFLQVKSKVPTTLCGRADEWFELTTGMVNFLDFNPNPSMLSWHCASYSMQAGSLAGTL